MVMMNSKINTPSPKKEFNPLAALIELSEKYSISYDSEDNEQKKSIHL